MKRSPIIETIHLPAISYKGVKIVESEGETIEFYPEYFRNYGKDVADINLDDDMMATRRAHDYCFIVFKKEIKMIERFYDNFDECWKVKIDNTIEFVMKSRSAADHLLEKIFNWM